VYAPQLPPISDRSDEARSRASEGYNFETIERTSGFKRSGFSMSDETCLKKEIGF
jgi:hypothetical protein